ncbi:lecithin-cholesterol acyltransferase-like 4 [Panicum miliaceum]|uniref:Lecithin-cholesterol acyltransferase-like 4 n=1 Tax=Panicum miliaceum TaxID=4540 RepID=A0A3L6TA45_PANMI|nr:lecithin-cholesterol acyltransferase-like 4 [Panicum miliaceum]
MVAGDGGGLLAGRQGGGSLQPRAVEDNRLACGWAGESRRVWPEVEVAGGTGATIEPGRWRGGEQRQRRQRQRQWLRGREPLEAKVAGGAGASRGDNGAGKKTKKLARGLFSLRNPVRSGWLVRLPKQQSSSSAKHSTHYLMSRLLLGHHPRLARLSGCIFHSLPDVYGLCGSRRTGAMTCPLTRRAQRWVYCFPLLLIPRWHVCLGADMYVALCVQLHRDRKPRKRWRQKIKYNDYDPMDKRWSHDTKYKGVPGYIATSLLNEMSFVEGWESKLFISKGCMKQSVWRENLDNNGKKSALLKSHEPVEAIKMIEKALSKNEIIADGMHILVGQRKLMIYILSSTKLPESVNFYNIYGTDYDTPHIIWFRVPEALSHVFTFRKNMYVDCEGSVPVESAKVDGLNAGKTWGCC